MINVVDAADPNMNQMIKTTLEVLDEIGVKDLPMITAYNKADLTDRNYPQIEGGDLLYSAVDPASIQALAKLITTRLFSNYQITDLRLPLTAGKDLAYLHQHSRVLKEDYQADGIEVSARLSPQDRARFSAYPI